LFNGAAGEIRTRDEHRFSAGFICAHRDAVATITDVAIWKVFSIVARKSKTAQEG
jgi:hypothetical protein